MVDLPLGDRKIECVASPIDTEKHSLKVSKLSVNQDFSKSE